MLAIFDTSSVNICRFNREIIRSHCHEYIAYVDDPDLCEPIDDGKCLLVCSGWWRVTKFIRHFRDNNISVIIVSGQRPADLRVLLAANALNIPIVYKMHGLYIPYMKRSIRFFLDQFSKSVRTLFYLIDVAMYTRDLSISFGMFMSFVFGRPRKIWASSELLRIEVGLIWSDYWEAWHKKYWAMDPKIGWLIMGNPDTLKFKKVRLKNDPIAYVYQTLVEDGRIDSKLMMEFYDSLERLSKVMNQTVVVKWHPRGDMGIRRSLISRGFKICDDFPEAKIYFGHYSSLLGLVPVMDAHVIVYELDGHPTPESVEMIASKIVFNYSELQRAIENFDASLPPKKYEAIHYFGNFFDENIEIDLINNLLKIDDL
tara:strand:- start:138 stop:1247 length:1110 start_codon:yes stop_codon:yes gene_type:complete